MSFLGETASTTAAAGKTRFFSILHRSERYRPIETKPNPPDQLDIPRQSEKEAPESARKKRFQLPETVKRRLKNLDIRNRSAKKETTSSTDVLESPAPRKADFSALIPKNKIPREYDMAPPMSPEVEVRVGRLRAERLKRLETKGHVAVWGERAFDSLVPAAREAVAPRKAGMTSNELQDLGRLQSQLLDEKKVKEMHPEDLEKLVSEFETKTSPEALNQILHLRPHERYPYVTTKWSLSDTLMAHRQKADINAAKDAFLKKYPNIDSLSSQDRGSVLESLEYLRTHRPDCEWTYEGQVRSESFPSKHWATVREEARAKHPIVQYSHQKLEPKDLGYEGNDMRGPEIYESLPEGGTKYIPKYQAIYERNGGGKSFWHRN